MKKMFKIIPVILALLIVGCGVAETNPSGGSKRIEISFDFTRMSTQATNQIAIWVEDASGQIIKNIYISDIYSLIKWIYL